MARPIFRAVLLASVLSVLESSVAAQAISASASTPPTATSINATATSINGASASTTLGCYQDPGTLVSQGDYAFQSLGYCQELCLGLQKPVMAVTNGTACYCGDDLPAIYQEVDMSSCDTPCAGFALNTCGGVGFWQFSLTGLTADVPTASNSTINSTTNSTTTITSSSVSQSSGSSTSQTADTTKPTATGVVTPSASATISPDQNTGNSGSRSTSPWMSFLAFSVLLPLLARCCT